MQNRKHIVILTTWFPPISGVAVNRMLAFAKYLDHKKFDVSVVTLKTDNSEDFEEVYGCKVHRLENKVKFKLPNFNTEDSQIKHKLKVVKKLLILKIQKNVLFSWQKAAQNKIGDIHRQQKVDCIISSFSPAAPHVVAANIISQFPEIKWIADMRDEMSENNSVSDSEKKYLQEIEKKVDQNASAVITVSNPIVEYFKTTFPNVKYIEEIRNGFDHEVATSEHHFNEVFTMLYAGSFYGKRKPNTFFEALKHCENELPKQWKIQFLGTSRNFDIPKNFSSHIEFISRVPQEESIAYMQNADVNIIIHPAEKRKGIFTGKLFDYASVGKPILAIIDKNDVAADLIKELNLGSVADFDNISEIEQGILQSISLWKNKETLSIDREGVKQLHRKFQVAKLTHLVEQILSTN